MPKAKTSRTTRAKAPKNVLQMPEVSSNGNGHHDGTTDFESEIRTRAYELYVERGYANGSADQDWLQAEREVLSRHGKSAQSA
jgi:hypothetical protein